MPVRIITDSTADIPPATAAELGIRVVPLHVHMGGKVYRDGVDLAPADFYRQLASSHVLPTTSTVAPAEFARAFDELAHNGDDVLAVTLSSRLSATFDAALQGREMRRNRRGRAEVLDSGLICFALGLAVVGAAERAREGAGLEAVAGYIRGFCSRVHVLMTFDTLEYLRRGGRIGAAEAFMGRLLDVKPVLTLKDGLAQPVVRRRTRARAVRYLHDFAAGFSAIAELGVAHTTTPEDAAGLADDLGRFFPRERVHLSRIGPVMGTHMGPGALGIGVVEPER